MLPQCGGRERWAPPHFTFFFFENQYLLNPILHPQGLQFPDTICALHGLTGFEATCMKSAWTVVQHESLQDRHAQGEVPCPVPRSIISPNPSASYLTSHWTQEGSPTTTHAPSACLTLCFQRNLSRCKDSLVPTAQGPPGLPIALGTESALLSSFQSLHYLVSASCPDSITLPLTHTHMCIHTHTHTCTQGHKQHTLMHIGTYSHVYRYTYIHTPTDNMCTHAHTCTYVYTQRSYFCACVHIYPHMCTLNHTCTQSHMHAHIYLQVNMCVRIHRQTLMHTPSHPPMHTTHTPAVKNPMLSPFSPVAVPPLSGYFLLLGLSRGRRGSVAPTLSLCSPTFRIYG